MAYCDLPLRKPLVHNKVPLLRAVNVGETSYQKLLKNEVEAHFEVLLQIPSIVVSYDSQMCLRLRVNEYDKEMPQTHTADQPTKFLGRDAEHQQHLDIKKTVNVKQPTLFSQAI